MNDIKEKAPVLIELDINSIFPHPDNPRKELGDITELAESIKARGIMQNLTVIPRGYGVEDYYTVIIGHRRLAAAKLAGLKTVPCVITHMTEKEQLATMLLENMQRNDLTLYEQAKGMQLMMDLGETIKDIANKTGFSEATVRRRVKLMRYDEEIMKESQTRQATFEQYMKLSEIEDISVANDILRYIGTKDFDGKVANAIRKQNEWKERQENKRCIQKYAELLEDSSYQAVRERGLITAKNIYGTVSEDELSRLKKEYGKLYYSEGYGFTIYRASTSEDKKIDFEREARLRARSDLEQKANDLYQAFKNRAKTWILTEYKPSKYDMDKINESLFDAFISDFGSTNYFWGLHEALGGNKPENYYEDLECINAQAYILERYAENKERTALLSLWYLIRCNNPATLRYNSTKLEWGDSRHNHLMWIFSLLSDLGYNVSDEEWSFINGTHPIYSESVPL